jgi:hypothetical protein
MKNAFRAASIFDSSFLPQALVFHASISKYSRNFELYWLCLDDLAYDILAKLKLKGVKLVRHNDFADSELKKLQKERSRGEYSWTCKGPFVEYLFAKFKLSDVFYLDIDISWWADPELAQVEVRGYSLGITPQRLSARYRILEHRSGKFNAGFIYFKNDKIGNKALKKWAAQCREWCYARFEKGKLGDQMYLNSWPREYKTSLVIVENKGINAACFNIAGVEAKESGGKLYLNGDQLVLFHYHGFVWSSPGDYQPSSVYKVTDTVRESIFVEYGLGLDKMAAKVMGIEPKYVIPYSSKKSIRKIMTDIILRTIFAVLDTFLVKS